MISFLVWLALAVSAVLCLPVLVLLTQVLAASFGKGRHWDLNTCKSTESADRHPHVAVVMPAHNEALGIREAIASVLPQLRQGDRLVVVADNCSDDTAQVALAAGSEVIERFDTELRGKGYALDFGIRSLSIAPILPDVVIVIDADCIVGPGALQSLGAACADKGRPIQALYLMHSPPSAGLKTRIAELAWVVKNHVRPLGSALLGWPCQLMGTGMAFPWGLIRNAPLASGHIVEDMQLGLDLAATGYPPLFMPSAVVSSQFPSQAEGTVSQRTRWEHGHLSVIAAHAPRLLWQCVRNGQSTLLAMVLDLCVPPLASLVLALLGWCVLSGVLAALTAQVLPAALAGSSLVALGLAVLLAWVRFAPQVVSGRELLSVPAYVFSKLPIYLKFLLKKGQVEWVRTKRDHPK